jgi:hypothetical protein
MLGIVRFLVVIAVLAPTRAQAQTRATALVEDQPYRPHGPAGLGGELVVGWAGQVGGPTGYVARLEYEVFPLYTPNGKSGPIVGFQPGLEWWRSGADNWGASLPVALVAGVRALPVRMTVGVGMDALLVDQVADDTGFGAYAPFAMARAGLDLYGIQLGVDTRIGYRWQLGAENHARWQLAIYAGGTIGPRTYRPAERGSRAAARPAPCSSGRTCRARAHAVATRAGAARP